MAKTLSTMPELGTKAADFALPDTRDGKVKRFSDLSSDKGTLVMFICNHCPFVIHIQEALVALTTEYAQKGIACIAISSNDAAQYPADAPDKMKSHAEENGFGFPYLYDESQEVAQSYDAACTPDFFLYDAEDKLVYRGQFDDSRPGSETPVSGVDLRAAMDALLAGDEPLSDQKPSMGCNIKWKQ